MDDAPEDDKAKKKRLTCAFLAALIGIAVGLACPLLPDEMQAACRIAAQLFRLVTG